MDDLFPWTFWAVMAGWGITYLVMSARVKRANIVAGMALKGLEINNMLFDLLLGKPRNEGNVVPFRRK